MRAGGRRVGAAVSKRLPDRKRILKVADILQHALGRISEARRDAGVDQVLLVIRFEASKIWRVDAVREIDAEGSDGRAVAHAEADGVHHVIEILLAALGLPQ